MNMTEKLQKVLARTGLASRRTIEEWIDEGRIKVNGKIAKLGDRVDSTAQIKVDGKLIYIAPGEGNIRVLVYNKSIDEICTRSDPEERPTVFAHLPKLKTGRWIAVGRLDINTSGLLLFTNNGELANKLMHPSSEVEREYSVRVLGKIDEKVLQRLKKGVRLEDGMARFNSIVAMGGAKGSNQWYRVTVREGKNRLVRRLWESQKVTVSRLMRVRFGNITLPRLLPTGHYTEMNEVEVHEFMKTFNPK